MVTASLPWQYTWLQTRYSRLFCPPASLLTICQWCLFRIIRQSYKYVRSSPWPSLIRLAETGKEWVAMETDFLIVVGIVPCRTVCLPNFNGLWSKLTELALIIYRKWYWVECMTSSVLSFKYFAYFLDLNISGTNRDNCKRLTAFLFFLFFQGP